MEEKEVHGARKKAEKELDKRDRAQIPDVDEYLDD